MRSGPSARRTRWRMRRQVKATGGWSGSGAIASTGCGGRSSRTGRGRSAGQVRRDGARRQRRDAPHRAFRHVSVHRRDAVDKLGAQPVGQPVQQHREIGWPPSAAASSAAVWACANGSTSGSISRIASTPRPGSTVSSLSRSSRARCRGSRDRPRGADADRLDRCRPPARTAGPAGGRPARPLQPAQTERASRAMTAANASAVSSGSTKVRRRLDQLGRATGTIGSNTRPSAWSSRRSSGAEAADQRRARGGGQAGRSAQAQPAQASPRVVGQPQRADRQGGERGCGSAAPARTRWKGCPLPSQGEGEARPSTLSSCARTAPPRARRLGCRRPRRARRTLPAQPADQIASSLRSPPCRCAPPVTSIHTPSGGSAAVSGA